MTTITMKIILSKLLSFNPITITNRDTSRTDNPYTTYKEQKFVKTNFTSRFVKFNTFL